MPEFDGYEYTVQVVPRKGDVDRNFQRDYCVGLYRVVPRKGDVVRNPVQGGVFCEGNRRTPQGGRG